jgi:hypothetical protein
VRITTNNSSVDIYPGYPETPDASTGALVVTGGRTVAPSRSPVSAPETRRQTPDVSTGVRRDVNQQRNQDTIVLRELSPRGVESLQLEQVRLAAARLYARGSPQYEYRLGSDGKLYVVGGGVTLDVSPVPGNPQGTTANMEGFRRADLALGQPSVQDYSVASRASYEILRTRMELMSQQRRKAQEGPTVMAQPKGTIIDAWV